MDHTFQVDATHDNQSILCLQARMPKEFFTPQYKWTEIFHPKPLAIAMKRQFLQVKNSSCPLKPYFSLTLQMKVKAEICLAV